MSNKIIPSISYFVISKFWNSKISIYDDSGYQRGLLEPKYLGISNLKVLWVPKKEVRDIILIIKCLEQRSLWKCIEKLWVLTTYY